MKIKHTWINEQIKSTIEQWDNTLITHYPESKLWMNDSNSYYNHIVKKCNYLNSTKIINWDSLLNNDSIIVDLGCGGGWLTGYLSKLNKIQKIYSIDSSSKYLEDFLPNVVKMMDGNIEKVETIQGLFYPVLLDSNSIDLVVISSAVHHADNICLLLQEINRILKPGGKLVILNETPTNDFKFLLKMIIDSITIFSKTIFKKFTITGKKISNCGVLYDPILGDVDYPRWYWYKSFKHTKFNLLNYVNSKLPTIIDGKGRYLQNFILEVIKTENEK